MSTKERAVNLLDMLSPADLEMAYQILKRLVISAEQPNRETVAAMLEADEIAHDPAVKGYRSIEELSEALDEE